MRSGLAYMSRVWSLWMYSARTITADSPAPSPPATITGRSSVS